MVTDSFNTSSMLQKLLRKYVVIICDKKTKSNVHDFNELHTSKQNLIKTNLKAL